MVAYLYDKRTFHVKGEVPLSFTGEPDNTTVD